MTRLLYRFGAADGLLLIGRQSPPVRFVAGAYFHRGTVCKTS